MKAILAAPRGFCAGVERAIKIVELALKKYGTPVYVRHEIVHNKHVVNDLQNKGAIFVENLESVPENAPVIFSAHGVSPAIHAQAAKRKLTVIDATCPLVSKVHYEVIKYSKEGYHIIVIGHKGHPEIEGTIGEAPDACTLVQTVQDVNKLNFTTKDKLAVVTQTTLSIDETKDILHSLQTKYPQLIKPPQEDICYATTNRQQAVKKISKKTQVFLIIGSKNSSNSKRLVDTARTNGTTAHLIDDVQDIQTNWLTGIETIGISAGASAPENLVQEVIRLLQTHGLTDIKEEKTAEENLQFSLPKILRD